MASKKIQERLAKASKRNSLKQVEPPKELVQELKSDKPAEKKTEPKKKGPRVDNCAIQRQKVTNILERAGFKGIEKSGWIRFQVRDGKISVASKGPQVHFRGFDFAHPHVEMLSDNEAKKRHLGSVRQILWMDRQTGDICEQVIKSGLK